MLNTNLESEYISFKDLLVTIIEGTSLIIDKLKTKYSLDSKPSFEFKYPHTDTNLSKNFKILEFHKITKARNDKNNLVVIHVLSDADDYLKKLKSRVMDNSLKVLITGDLNSGKSTLINAIFHQNILPTDQQPCTQSFCEVIPSNEKIKFPKIKAYKLVSFGSNEIGDNISHEQMTEELQNEDSSYKWFKIAVSTPSHVSNNSNQMCVSFIDSPGLNTDLFKTTSLFSQQQDIDVVVFVVNASFHLTLSGKEFLEQAAKEKEKIFFVVNKFDEIENFKKCRKLITKQIREILPETFEDAQNLIHFVSAKNSLAKSLNFASDAVPSNEITINPDDESQIKDASKYSKDFNNMTSSLLNFLYTKRAISKLSPAKTFSTRLLQDLLELSSLNQQHMKAEAQSIESKLSHSRKIVQKQKIEELQLRSELNQVVLSSADLCFKSVLSQAISFSEGVPKILNASKFTGIWNLRVSLTEKYKRIAQSYSHTMSKIETDTCDVKQKGHRDIDRIAEKYGMEKAPRSIAEEEFRLYSVMPLRKPALLELFDLRDFIQNFGTLNLTSMVGAVAGFQPCVNLIWKFARRIGINPIIISALIFGGFGAFAVYTTSSSIERAIHDKLEMYFTSRFNKEIWAADLADRCKQSVVVSLSSKSSQVFVAYQRLLESNRNTLSELIAGSEELTSEIDYFYNINRQIETLLKTCNEIKL